MTHEELATRIEALDGPDRDVFIEAWVAVNGPISKPEESVFITDEALDFLDFLDVEAYLDAANSLMPDGWEPVGVHWWQKSRCSAYSSRSDGRYAITTFAKTEPLARLAAAVRAHGKGVE